jgi:hypothetical protein
VHFYTNEFQILPDVVLPVRAQRWLPCTYITAISEEMLQIGDEDQRLSGPMITSIVPNPNNADVYNEYAKLAVYHDDGGEYKLDEYLRLVRPDGDESRIESLLEMIFERSRQPVTRKLSPKPCVRIHSNPLFSCSRMQTCLRLPRFSM